MANAAADKGFYATGRRKESTARVWIKEGSGQVVVNGRTMDEYFGRETSKMVLLQPLELVEQAIKPAGDPHFARTRLFALEDTWGGRVLPRAYVADAAALASPALQASENRCVSSMIASSSVFISDRSTPR